LLAIQRDDTEAIAAIFNNADPFACHACGLVEDRDRNAARTILARAGLNPAAADAVRHLAPPPGVPMLAEAGIPRL